MTSKSSEHIPIIVSIIKDTLGLYKLDSKTIHIILKEAIELVDELNIPGSEKHDNVIQIIKVLVEDLVDDSNEKRLILDIVENKIFENTMDLIIQASKGELNINNAKTQEQLAGCFTLISRAISSFASMCRKKLKDKDVN
jgi:hypothetical protein